MKPRSGFAVASLVLGILDIIIAVTVIIAVYAAYNISLIGWGIFIILPFIIAVSAIVFGVIAIRQTKYNSNHRGRGLAIAGLCLGGTELFLMILVGGTLSLLMFL